MTKQELQRQISFVTYNELMLLWNISVGSAKGRLNTIRKILGKDKIHRLTVEQYCKAEDISTDFFFDRLTLMYQPAKKTA